MAKPVSQEPKVSKMHFGQPGPFMIPLSQALEELKDAYEAPEVALSQSSIDNPLNCGSYMYWK